MLRQGTTFLKKSVVATGIDLIPQQNAICIQQARGLRPRKPAYSGIAKTKLFRIPKVPVYPPDEKAEIVRLGNQYRTFMKSIRNHFKLENQTHAAGSAEAAQGIEAEEAEWQESLLRLKQWNEEVALKRNERLLSEQAAKKLEIETRIQEEAERQAQRLKEIDEIIRKEKELSKSYITPENIDQAIAKALDDKLDYNYAIDVRGNKYVGRFVNDSGEEELPQSEETDETSLPPLFQSSPISSGASK
ncbi:probable 28S ribosomal protein S26, mitochondrial [Thrips palmi]|uniref:Small ribosomal subunit protein mS26 n=1 Tax=Thrips palmi TaxID=161013 RepID=A0A6P8Z2Y5_THRPL|nr:probable 28S ribosomal protein S26, mitochondrial [Thrips palmi]